MNNEQETGTKLNLILKVFSLKKTNKRIIIQKDRHP